MFLINAFDCVKEMSYLRFRCVRGSLHAYSFLFEARFAGNTILFPANDTIVLNSVYKEYIPFPYSISMLFLFVDHCTN